MSTSELNVHPVKAAFSSDSARQLLTRSVSALIGVSESAEAVLNDLGIQTIQDLAASQLFNTARRITSAARAPTGQGDDWLSGDILDNAVIARTPREVAELPLASLRAITPTTAASIQTAMGIQQVQELASWPPYRAACHILNEAYGDGTVVLDDPERPDELVPAMRRYATERVQYDIIVMDKVLSASDVELAKSHLGSHGEYGATQARIDLSKAGAIDIADVVSAALTARPAIGAVLTYRQSWYQQGLALGHLLHSMALAPGESTRIAMVDWNRTVRGRSDEDTTQAESLVANVGRTRAMSEVTSSVAREAQQGFSGSNSTANQEQVGETYGEASVGMKGSDPGTKSPGDSLRLSADSRGTSSATSTATTSATGWASSSGTRSLNSEMTQNINDRTHQAANSVRNRRATAITETSQKESESLSTRVVTNYNHMHALTIQYFEVIQIYRVSVELAKATRCLFVPMKLVTFTWDVVRRFKNVIASAGLIPDVQALRWLQPNQMLVTSPSQAGPWDRLQTEAVARVLGDQVVPASGNALILPLQGLRILGLSTPQEGSVSEIFDSISIFFKDGSQKNYPLKEQNEIRDGIYGAVLPSDGSLRLDPSLAISMRRIVLNRRSGKESEKGVLSLGLAFDVSLPDNTTVADRLGLPNCPARLPIRFNEGDKNTVVLELVPSFAEADVLDHLEQNALYYSSAIWRSLDSATITTMLSTYEFGGRPLIEVIDPVPLSMSGNYLIFRLYGEENGKDWQAFLAKHDLVNPVPKEDWVPLPSGGVFAEAVLGRSNSAEKLDITRFWNWQDSPIPILPPEINPLTAGGKDNPPTTGTGALEGSIVNIVNPPSLPDPAGLAPLYSAIANGNMFRDMSGMAQTAALAQAALQAAQAGASDATSAAGQAQQVAATQLTEFLKLAAQVAMAAMGGGGAVGGLGAIGGSSGGSKPGVSNTPSNAGALINHGKAMDAASDHGRGLSSNSSGSGGGPNGDDQHVSSGDDSSASSGESDAFGVALNGGGFRSPLGMLATTVMGAQPSQKVEATGVIRAFPGLDPAITEPASRTCCAIFPGGVASIGMTQYLDTFDLGEHSYGSSGIFPRDTVGQVYTARGGFVDLGHVRDLADTARFLASRAFAWRLPARENGRIVEERVALRREGGTRTLILTRQVDGCVECASLVGARAAYDLAIWHEIVTWFTNVRYSSFSPEDNFSNLLGSLLGAMATATRGKSYNEAMTALLDDWLETLQAQPGSTARNAIQQLNGLWFVDDDLAPALQGGNDGNERGLLMRRHVQPLPTVTPWLVTDLNGQSFTYSDPVAGVHQTTIAFELGNAAPAPYVLRLPQTGPRGEVITDHYTIEIDVDTRVVPASVLPSGRTRIRSDDLPTIVDQVRALILAQYPRGDQPSAP